MTESIGDLAAHARHTRVVVIGGGIAGLVAAWECAKVGMPVTLLEAADELGGNIRGDEVIGTALDLGVECFATRGGHVRALVDELGLGDDIVEPAPDAPWVAGLPRGAAAPLPKGGVLGIPPNPFADDVRRVIGGKAVWRAYLDRLRPPMTIGHERSLGKLVRSRMGQVVLDRLVAPITRGVFQADPDDIDVDLAAPGLNAALTRTGSLSGAVMELAGERAEKPGTDAPILGLRGGMIQLVEALRDRLDELDVDIRTATPATAIAPGTDARWLVRAEPAPAPDAAPRHGSVAETGHDIDGSQHEPSVSGATTLEFPAEAVIVAVPEGDARRMLTPVVPQLEAVPETPGVELQVVTLVIDAPALNVAPRGTAVFTVPGSHTAQALTHASAKWPWLGISLVPGYHVVRVTFGGPDAPPVTAGLEPADAVVLAVREASALLGVPLDPDALVRARIESFVQPPPASAIGRDALVRGVRAAIHAVPGLAATGAWLSGTGLAQVVPDAIDEAERVRKAALWG